ncbi:MAG: uracil phosphoribosyltransferase [Chitinophagales bacterium]
MVTNFSNTNTLVSCWIQEIRDIGIQTDRMRFRRNLERIGEVSAYEISKMLPYRQVDVQTPMGMCTCSILEKQPVLATILRAGLPLHQGLLNFFDQADCAFIGAYRRHNIDDSFEIHQQYVANPELDGRPLIISDPMLATGASLSLALKTITEKEQPSQIHIVTAIACNKGIDYIQDNFPEAYIWAGAIDEELTAKGYIFPGLGDAGDLAFGKKKQF